MGARDDNPKLHRIEVDRDADGEITAVRFVCDGDDSAPCHRWPDCGCEEWGQRHYVEDWDPENPHAKRTPLPGHEDVQQQSCWIDPWFNDCYDLPSEWAEAYDGDDDGHMVPHPDGGVHDDLSWLISGPISVTWEGDYMTWEYAT